jgi:hypothetical protein
VRFVHAAAIADRIATAGLIFGFNFSVFYVIDIFFVMAPSGPVPFTDSSLMWFSSAILRASGDTFIFRISAVLWRTFDCFSSVGCNGTASFFFFCI